MFLEIIVLLLAIPTGYIIAFLTPEELSQGKKYFKTIIIVSILTAIWFFLTKQLYVTFTLIFIAIVTFISLNKKL